jgi:hypothetical protein
MLLHALSRSARAGKLQAFAALALFVVGCTQATPGDLLSDENPVQSGDGDEGEGGAGGSTSGATTAGSGGKTSSGSGATSASSGGTTSSSTTSSSSGMTPQQATFVVSVDNASPDVDLDDQVDLTITIAPNGYSGSVALAVNNLGNGGITGDLSPGNKVTLDGSTPVKVKLTLTTMSSTPPGDVGFSVSGTVATGAKTASATLTVRPAITIVIPKGANQLGGTATNPYKMAFGDYPMNVIAPQGISAQNPLTVRFFNDDDVSHEIHAANQSQGFPHDPGPIAPHTMDGLVRKVNAKGLYDYYLHDQGKAITIGRLAVQ